MKNERISISSDENSQDGKSCRNSAEHSQEGNAYSSLCRHNWEHCEFCDKLFSNRYDMFKHNISHIIIPLIKQTTHQCDACLHHFTSVEDLTSHISNKHQGSTPNGYVPDSPVRLKTQDEFKDKIPEILQSIVEKQVYVKCEDELKEVFAKCNELLNKNIIENSDLSTPTEPSVSLKEEPVTPQQYPGLAIERSSPIEEESVRNRLMFEDDFDDNLFRDLTTDCQVSLESICQQINPEFDDSIMPFSDAELKLADDGIDIDIDIADPSLLNIQSNAEECTDTVDSNLLIVRSTATEDATDAPPYSETIHYDVLMEPERCICRLCAQEFPNRFILVQHETTHIHMKPKHRRNPLCCICDRQIAGNYHNLRRHIQEKHPEQANFDIQYSTHYCPKCHLKYYNYKTHVKNYHELYKCQKCERGFESEKLRTEHDCRLYVKRFSPPKYYSNESYKQGLSFKNNLEASTAQSRIMSRLSFEDNLEGRTAMPRTDTRIISLCTMCFSFMKIYIQNRNNYEIVGVKSEIGVQQICDKCHNKFFEVTLVKRRQLCRDPLKPKTKPISNKQRLKNVQNRLKMMKYINKF